MGGGWAVKEIEDGSSGSLSSDQESVTESISLSGHWAGDGNMSLILKQ